MYTTHSEKTSNSNQEEKRRLRGVQWDDWKAAMAEAPEWEEPKEEEADAEVLKIDDLDEDAFDAENGEELDQLAEQLAEQEERFRYAKESKFEIVSKVAYLIGVPKAIFESETHPPKLEVFKEMEKDSAARIVRHLCMVRTGIERNFKKINLSLKSSNMMLSSLEDNMPDEVRMAMQRLRADGADFYRTSSKQVFQHIVVINGMISDRVNNCKHWFPTWVNWNYVRQLFIMPNGTTKQGTEDAVRPYYEHRDWYPYSMYINWEPQEVGNLLGSDAKFIKLLYAWNNDYFADRSKVSDVGEHVRGSIYDFIERSLKVDVIVDCENSDPYKLSAAFQGLDEHYTQRINKIILIDDKNASSAWKILEEHVKIPVEYKLVERLKENKSQVDQVLSTTVCRECLRSYVDAFILVSSDSDYWGMMKEMQNDARFYVMVERLQCSPKLKDALDQAGIEYCYLDDFYSGDAEELKNKALLRQVGLYLRNTITLNINHVFEYAVNTARVVNMSDAEKEQFKRKYLRTLEIGIEDDGSIVVSVPRPKKK